MRRIRSIGVVALTLLALFACGPGISIRTEEPNGFELLFDLPESCVIVSEEFALTTEETGYTGNYHAEAMLVTATYLIENEGEATTITALVPAPRASFALAYPGSYYRLEADGTVLDGTWMMRFPRMSAMVYADYAADMKALADFDPGVVIHRTAFDLPMDGNHASMTISENAHRILAGEFWRLSDRLELKRTTIAKRATAYGFGTPAELSFDYEAHPVTVEITFAELLLDLAGSGSDAFHQGIYAVAIERFLASDETAIGWSELYPDVTDEGIESVFRYEIPVAPMATPVTFTQPIWASCDMVAESCVYRFAFDEERYSDGSIPVTLSLMTDRTVASSTFVMTDDSLLFDPTKNLLEIDTLAFRSVGSLGSRPIATDAS